MTARDGGEIGQRELIALIGNVGNIALLRALWPAAAAHDATSVAYHARKDELERGRPAILDGGLVTFPAPEDRGLAVLSDLGTTEYVADLIRPGRIVVVGAEEGSGKSYAIDSELGIRVAVAGGSFAGTWEILQTGPVCYLSEMHPDDDFDREGTVLESLALERSALGGAYYRLPLMTAAAGHPCLTVPAWRDWFVAWARDHGLLLAIFDTATGATQVDPWGREIQAVFADLRAMLEAVPALAVVLLVHLKKPSGRGERRLSDVLGEWGRWCDVVMLLEADGDSRTKVTVRKRVRHERRIVATKAGGLLVDPVDVKAGGAKVSLDKVVAAITPGMTTTALAAVLGVTKQTALTYSKAAENAGLIARIAGKRGQLTLYPADSTVNRQTPSNRHALTVVGRSDVLEGTRPSNVQPSYIEDGGLFDGRSPDVLADYPESATNPEGGAA